MLTPIDIETKEFKKNFGGYSKEDVDEFMHMLLVDYKSMYMENIALKDKVSSLGSAVGRYKSMEDVLQNTLIVAQNTSDELKRVANEEAKTIILKAENTASEMVLSAQKRVSDMEFRYNQLAIDIENYKEQMTNIIKSQLKLTETIPVKTANTEEKGEN